MYCYAISQKNLPSGLSSIFTFFSVDEPTKYKTIESHLFPMIKTVHDIDKGLILNIFIYQCLFSLLTHENAFSLCSYCENFRDKASLNPK